MDASGGLSALILACRTRLRVRPFFFPATRPWIALAGWLSRRLNVGKKGTRDGASDQESKPPPNTRTVGIDSDQDHDG
jgi:hypothetical protein